MPYATSTDGCRIHYEVHGEGDPLMLVSGLGGVGRAWGRVIDMAAEHYLTIVPDHRGTGASDAPADGYTIAQHAADMAAILEVAGCGPSHIVGSSTGGAIAQQMALDHKRLTRSIVLVDSWAKADDWFRHQFAVRKKILLDAGPQAYVETTALFLFSPRYFRDHFSDVEEWIAQAGAGYGDLEVVASRIDMIVEFDLSDRLGRIAVPALVIVGSEDVCTPPYFAEELVGLIPGAAYSVIPGGHLIYKEAPQATFDTFHRFVSRL